MPTVSQALCNTYGLQQGANQSRLSTPGSRSATEDECCGLNVYAPLQRPYVESLIPSWMVIGGGALGGN